MYVVLLKWYWDTHQYSLLIKKKKISQDGHNNVSDWKEKIICQNWLRSMALMSCCYLDDQSTDFGLCRTWCPSLSGLPILCLRGKVPGREKQAKHGPGERGRCMLCPLPVRLGDCDPVTEKGLWPRKGEKPGGLESSAGSQRLFRGTGLSTPLRGVACI